MGLFGTQWIQDMMDVSCGFGSWQLTMNAGLAHMQATSLINSCFSFSGFGFTPYSSMSSMDYLLNPNFAAWQASNGISSNPASIFGNWGGMANSYTGGTTFTPWGNTWTNNTPDSTGNTGSKKREEDKPYENKATDLKNLLNGYADYLKKTGSGGNKTEGENIEAEVKKYWDDSELSWQDISKKLDVLYKKILNNSTHKEYIANYIADKTEITIDGEPKNVKACLNKAGLNESKYKNIANTIKGDINTLDAEDPNIATLESAVRDAETLLGVISAYNGSLIGDFCNKYNKDITDVNKKATASQPVIMAIETLIAEADSISKDLKDCAELNNAVRELRKNVKNGFNTDNLKTRFEKLYAAVRVAEAAIIEERIKAKYDTIDGDKLAKNLDFVNKTKEDLAEELHGSKNNISQVNNLVGKITAKKETSVESVTGRGGTVDNGDVDEDMTPEEREAFRNEVEDNVKGNKHFAEQQNSYVTPEADNTKLKLTKDKQYQVYKETHLGKTCYYVINDDGNMVVVEQKDGKYIPKNNTKPQSFDYVKNTIDSQVEADNEAKRAKEEADKVALRNNFKNPVNAPNWTIVSGDHSAQNMVKNMNSYIKSISDKINTKFEYKQEYGYDKTDWENAVTTLKEYYEKAMTALKNIDTTEYASSVGEHDKQPVGCSFTYTNHVTDSTMDVNDTSSLCKFDTDDDVKDFKNVKDNRPNTIAKTGICIGVNKQPWPVRNKIYIFIDTDILFEKFKSFLPD